MRRERGIARGGPHLLEQHRVGLRIALPGGVRLGDGVLIVGIVDQALNQRSISLESIVGDAITRTSAVATQGKPAIFRP
jgi:hypothetical protein